MNTNFQVRTIAPISHVANPKAFADKLAKETGLYVFVSKTELKVSGDLSRGDLRDVQTKYSALLLSETQSHNAEVIPDESTLEAIAGLATAQAFVNPWESTHPLSRVASVPSILELHRRLSEIH